MIFSERSLEEIKNFLEEEGETYSDLVQISDEMLAQTDFCNAYWL